MSASANNWAGEGMFAERIPEKHEPSPMPEPDSRQGEETAARAFVLVPREPTPKMIHAAYSDRNNPEWGSASQWAAMLAASPAVPATQGAVLTKDSALGEGVGVRVARVMAAAAVGFDPFTISVADARGIIAALEYERTGHKHQQARAESATQRADEAEKRADEAEARIRELEQEVREIEPCRLCGKVESQISADCGYIKVARCLANKRGLAALSPTPARASAASSPTAPEGE